MKKIAIDIQRSLDSNKAVSQLWKTLTPIAQYDFVQWIESAKQQETRNRRIEQMGDKLLSGKRRPCCYAVVPMDLYTALNKNQKAKAVWKNLSPDARRGVVGSLTSTKAKVAYSDQIKKVIATLASGGAHK